ncbi:MAG: sigma-54 dependent transcriptional regulator [Nitrospirota bacterium]
MANAISDRRAVPHKTRAPFTILVVEDDASDTELILHTLEQADLKVFEGDLNFEVRATAEGALKLLSERAVDLVLTDMVLPGMDGLDLVSKIQEIDRNLPVLVVTRINGVPQAVDAMRRGAYDYIVKPVYPQDLGMRLHRAIRFSEILRRSSMYERIARQELQAGNLVGVSPAFQNVMRQVREAAQVRSTVLITGETGTGKGLIARAIHEHSRERDKPYQVIDCTTVPEGIMESELFGHVRGAFTGAVSNKPGLIELANGGSVFLDEIGELPLPLQAKLLRVLEDSEVRPVGGTAVKRVDMRFIAATNQNLEEKVKRGAFRADLYYRLAVVLIRVPPLRERVEDIAVIARHLLAQLGREMGKPRSYFDASAIDALTSYRWLGNVRELRNVIERCVMLATEDAITRSQIDALLPSANPRLAESQGSPYIALPYMEAKRKAIEDFTRAYLKTKLAIHGGLITKAAKSSHIPRQHFSLLMKRYLEPSGSDEQNG